MESERQEAAREAAREASRQAAANAQAELVEGHGNVKRSLLREELRLYEQEWRETCEDEEEEARTRLAGDLAEEERRVKSEAAAIIEQSEREARQLQRKACAGPDAATHTIGCHASKRRAWLTLCRRAWRTAYACATEGAAASEANGWGSLDATLLIRP